jgi:hypothetical protein
MGPDNMFDTEEAIFFGSKKTFHTGDSLPLAYTGAPSRYY